MPRAMLGRLPRIPSRDDRGWGPSPARQGWRDCLRQPDATFREEWRLTRHVCRGKPAKKCQ